jgi:hypothetical protein
MKYILIELKIIKKNREFIQHFLNFIKKKNFFWLSNMFIEKTFSYNSIQSQIDAIFNSVMKRSF